MAGLLKKLPQETEKGKAIVKATFKSSHAGIIAGCQVTEGTITRSNHIRLCQTMEKWFGKERSFSKTSKEDVREVQKGIECGIFSLASQIS